MKSAAFAAGSLLGLCALGAPARAATVTLTCELQSVEDNELYNNNASLRLNGYSEVTEKYRIDSAANSVTLVSRTGRRYAPPENGGEMTPVNDPMAFYQDVRSLNDQQVIFCRDEKFMCKPSVIDQGALDSTVTTGLTVIDLESGRISYSNDQLTRRKDGSGYLAIRSKFTGTCVKG